MKLVLLYFLVVHLDLLVYSLNFIFLLTSNYLLKFDEIINHLFEGKSKDSIEIFSCSHVMPKENLMAISLSSGPSNQKFNFNFQNRNNPQLINDLGSCIANICMVVPDGVVVFFPSYHYQQKERVRY